MGRHPYKIVGRDTERKDILDAIVENRYRAILVLGNQGMGKSRLLASIEDVEEHSGIKILTVQVDVDRSDTIDTICESLLSGALQANKIASPWLASTPLGTKKWEGIFQFFEAAVDVKEKFEIGFGLGTLVSLLKALTTKKEASAQEKLLELVAKIASPTGVRLVLIFDSTAEAMEGQHASWLDFVKKLPGRVTCVFANRPAGSLDTIEFTNSRSVLVYPAPNGLQPLADSAVDEIVDQAILNDKKPGQNSLGLSEKEVELKAALRLYEGWPYVIISALEMVTDPWNPLPISELPPDPAGVSESLWRQICKHGEDAIKLMIAYHVLSRPASVHAASATAGLSYEACNMLLNQRFLSGLLPCLSHGETQQNGRRIFHSMLTEEIDRQIPEGEQRRYRERALAYYEEIVKNCHESIPDVDAILGLLLQSTRTESIRVAVVRFVNVCIPQLERAGAFEVIDATTEFFLKASSDKCVHAALYGNLAFIRQVKGDLVGADELLRKALSIDEALGNKHGIAASCGNLAQIRQIQGNLVSAEQLIHKALELGEELGDKQGIATSYTSLGLIRRVQGDLAAAEECFRKALALGEELGDKKSMALGYGNLGLIRQIRGDLVGAEQLIHKALKLGEELGDKQGMARGYGNLGLIRQVQGDLVGAEQFIRMALKLDEELGDKQGMVRVYGSLGLIRQAQSDLAGAEELVGKALILSGELRDKEAIATCYSHLGLIRKHKGDFAGAREFHFKALKLSEELGDKQGVAIEYGSLGVLSHMQGKVEEACQLFRQALALFGEVGAKPQIAQTQAMIDQYCSEC